MHLSLDLDSAEDRYRLEPADEQTPEKLYERRWAMLLLERTILRLREEYRRADKVDIFDHLKVFLGGDGRSLSYKTVAEKLGTTEGAVKVAVQGGRGRPRAWPVSSGTLRVRDDRGGTGGG